jgi:hypothetical protein
LWLSDDELAKFLPVGGAFVMRAFIVACVVAIIIAIAAALALDRLVQESSSKSYSTSAVRL